MRGTKTLTCTDRIVKHDFTFTPAVSPFVACKSEADIRRLSSALADSGCVLMPLGHYGFGRMFAWVRDRYGVGN
jgi:predicted 3-demethylubiquinone-9 3-methyltransferase (glyoxalase superfamily)